MEITDTLVRAIARVYTTEQLRQKLTAAAELLGSGSVITQAATGSGTSYTRQLTMTPDEAVELYQLALDYRENNIVNAVHVETFFDPGTAC